MSAIVRSCRLPALALVAVAAMMALASLPAAAYQLTVKSVEEGVVSEPAGDSDKGSADGAATDSRDSQADASPSQEGATAGDEAQPDAPLPRGDAAADGETSAPPSDDAAAATPERLLEQAFQLSKNVKSADDVTKMIELCERAIQGGPNPAFEKYAKQLTSWAYNRRGELLADEGENERALADFEKSLEYDDTRWKAYHNRAVSEAMAGNYDAALADFAKTIELKPSYANAYFNRGELLYDRGEFEAAIEDYSRAIRITPRDAGAYNSRGHAWYRLGNYDRALADYGRAIQLDGENAAAYVNRGDAYGDLGQYARAASDYRNAIRIDPKLGRAYQSAAWLMATCPEQRFRNAEFALTAAKKAIELDGDNYRYLDTLAAAYANAGKFEDAQSTAARAVEQAPPEVAEMYKARLEKYVSGEPYREPRPDRRNLATAQSQGLNRRRGR